MQFNRLIKKIFECCRKNRVRVRVNPQGLMGSASRPHKPKKGKGSFKRKKRPNRDD